MAYREGRDPVDAAPGVADVTIPAGKDLSAIFAIGPGFFALGFALWQFLHVAPEIAFPSVLVAWIALVAAYAIRRRNDPGFVFDDTALRIPPLGFRFSAKRVFYTDIVEARTHRKGFEIETMTSTISDWSRSETRPWDHELLGREIRLRVARAVRDTNPQRAIDFLTSVDRDRADLAPLYEKVGNLDEARRIYRLVRDHENARRVEQQIKAR